MYMYIQHSIPIHDCTAWWLCNRVPAKAALATLAAFVGFLHAPSALDVRPIYCHVLTLAVRTCIYLEVEEVAHRDSRTVPCSEGWEPVLSPVCCFLATRPATSTYSTTRLPISDSVGRQSSRGRLFRTEPPALAHINNSELLYARARQCSGKLITMT